MISILGIVLTLTISSEYVHSRLIPPRPNEVVLLDSRESGWKNWTKNTVSDIGWRQQSRPGAGYTVFGLCETSNSADQGEFWLFSPLISLGRALSIHMQVNFMLRSCADREIADGLGDACRENFDVFLQQEVQQSDMDAAVVPRIESFKKLAKISSDRKWSSTYPSDDTAVTSWLIRFRPQTDQSLGSSSASSATNGWMRLAIRDQGACLMLDRIRVYFLSCPAWQVGFMSLPETPAGHDAEVREVQGHCVSGAEAILPTQAEFSETEPSNQSKGLKPSFCKANGQWHIMQDNVCECLPGFESLVEENLCISCPVGTYKPFHGTGLCRPCPSNSTSEASTASKRCVCSHPLYVWQNLADDGSGICSPKLPRISDIEIIEKNAERIITTWKQPFAPDFPIFVAIACLNCQKDEAVYVPGNILTGNQKASRKRTLFPPCGVLRENVEIQPKSRTQCAVRLLPVHLPTHGLEPAKVDGSIVNTNSTNSVLKKRKSKLKVKNFKSGSPLQMLETLVGMDFLASKCRVPKNPSMKNKFLDEVRFLQDPTKKKELPNQKHFRQNVTETGSEEMTPVITVFHVLLGLTVFVCMTLLFVFGAVIMHRMLTNVGRNGETFIGQMKSAPLMENNTLSVQKIFLRPALPSTAVEAAEIASRVRHPNIVFCHGILRAIQPPLLVYNFMTFGRLDRFLVSEIGRVEKRDPNRKDSNWSRSPLLSTKKVFQMLHQIASAFSFLVSLSLDNICLDSSSVMVSSDYSCKVQLKICPSESSRRGNTPLISELDLKQSLADFIGIRRPSKVFVIQGGHQVLLPSILKNSTDSMPPPRLFQSLIWSLKSSSYQDDLSINNSSLISSTAVKKFGWIQIELLLAAVFHHRCVLQSFRSSDLPTPSILEKSSRLSKLLEWKDNSRLLEDVVSLVSQWFSNEFLGCIINSCLDPESSRRPSLSEVENHLKYYFSDKDTKMQKGKVTAVIHGEDMLSLLIMLCNYQQIHEQSMISQNLDYISYSNANSPPEFFEHLPNVVTVQLPPLTVFPRRIGEHEADNGKIRDDRGWKTPTEFGKLVNMGYSRWAYSSAEASDSSGGRNLSSNYAGQVEQSALVYRAEPLLFFRYSVATDIEDGAADQPALEWLNKAQIVYQEYRKIVNEANGPECWETLSNYASTSETDTLIRSVILECSYTTTLFMLAQIYSNLKEKNKSAEFCRKTLLRQLELAPTVDALLQSFDDAKQKPTKTDESGGSIPVESSSWLVRSLDVFDPIEWAVNASTLSEFYSEICDYTSALECLLTAKT
ncbi:hypothetical protein Aperf_G00000058930 [Anoplocephala perfoliata]